jgi:hypothetical protein
MVWACGLDSSGSEWDPVAGSCGHGNEPSGSIYAGNLLTSWATISFTRRNLLHVVSNGWKTLLQHGVDYSLIFTVIHRYNIQIQKFWVPWHIYDLTEGMTSNFPHSWNRAQYLSWLYWSFVTRLRWEGGGHPYFTSDIYTKYFVLMQPSFAFFMF